MPLKMIYKGKIMSIKDEKNRPPAAYLAPMAGVSDLPFRSLCFDYGCSGATSEMVSAKALSYESRKTFDLMQKGPNEGELVIQLFGHDPEDLARAIEKYINEDDRFSAVELNMGCPANKIVKNNDGSALMRQPKLAEKILKRMVKASEKPVYLKFRTGWDNYEENFIEIGRLAEDCGIERLTLHARSREMGYSGRADWGKIKALKEAVNIPVIGNGDIEGPEDFISMIEQTGADGGAIGRAAMGRPYIFQQIRDYFLTGSYRQYEKNEILDILIAHYKAEIDYRGEEKAILELRKNISPYLSGMIGNARIKQALLKEKYADKIFKIIEDFKKTSM